ncbi:olfactory receptor, partial [Pelobates cultripes]
SNYKIQKPANKQNKRTRTLLWISNDLMNTDISRIILFSTLLLVYIMTLTGNLLIIILVSATQYLHSPMYFFLGQLSSCDILLTTSIIPNLLHITLNNGITMSVSQCIAQFNFFSFPSATECILLTMMSYDRYVAVCKPLHYVTIMNSPLCLCLVAFSWILGFLITLIFVILLSNLTFCNSNYIDHFFCDLDPLVQLSCSDTTVIRTVLILIALPETVAETVYIISTYVCIFLAIHRISSTTGRQKAFSTCSSHLAVVCTYYGTLIAIYVFPSGESSSEINKIVSLMYTVVTPLLNPVIYSLRNQEIKTALGKSKKVLEVLVKGMVWLSRQRHMIPTHNQSTIPQFFLLGFQLLRRSRIILFSTLLLVYIMTLTGNLLIIILVSATQYLHSPMYFFLTQLSSCDIILTTSISPTLLHITLNNGFPMSVSQCIAQFNFFSFSSATECLLLTMMSYDRYVAVCKPLHYVTIMNIPFCLSLVAFSWILGILITLIVSILLSNLTFCNSKYIDHFFCDLDPLVQLSCSDTTVVRTVLFLIALPETVIETVFIVSTYVCIFLAIHRISSTTGRQKAFSTCSSHLAVVCLYYGTLIAIYVFPSGKSSSGINKTVSLMYTVVTPLLNPVIYSLRNQDIKTAMDQILTKQNEVEQEIRIDTEFFLLGFQLLNRSRIILFSTLLLVYIMTLTGNLLIIILVSATQYLRSPMYFFLSQLSSCDIILTTSIIPNLLYITLQNGIPMSVSQCIAQFNFFSFPSGTECLLLTIMSYDRYVAVCKPLHYVTIMNFPFCLSLVVLSWILGFLLTLIFVILLSNLTFCNSKYIDNFFCDIVPLVQLSCSDTTVVRTVIFWIAGPETVIETVFIISTYVYIFLAIHRISSTTGRQKAFSTCSSHLAVVCTYYGTLIAIYVFPSGEHSFDMSKIVSLMYTVVTPLLNPVIYSLRNQEIKTAIIKIGVRYLFGKSWMDLQRGAVQEQVVAARIPRTEFLLLGFQLMNRSRIMLFSALLFVYIMTLTGNLLIIILVSVTQDLHSPMYFFLSQLSSCDIILTTSIIPNLLHITLKNGVPMSVSQCIAQFSFFSFCSVTECLLLTMMSYDRYVAICKPLHYVTIMNSPFCFSLVVLSWILGFLITLIFAILLSNLTFCNSKYIDHFFCDLVPLVQLSCSDTTVLQTVIFLIGVPETVIETVFIISTYVCIFLAIHRISSTTGRQKAFSTCSSHVSVVCMYYGTLIAIYVFPSGEYSFGINKIISLMYTVVSPLLNPVIYTLRGSDHVGLCKAAPAQSTAQQDNILKRLKGSADPGYSRVSVRMGQWVRLSCLLLVLLVSDPEFVFSRKHVLSRNRRQYDSWWGRTQSGWGSSRLNVGVVGQSRQLQTTVQHPISVQCMEDAMVVSVQRDLYGNGRLVKASDLSLGPRQCMPSSQSTVTTVIFQQGLQDCGNTLQMTSGYLIYSTYLTYSPTPSRNSPIIRSNSAVIPIQCYYVRHGNVSSNAIKPTWIPFASTISAEERLSFSLKLMNDDWSALRTSTVFTLGDIFHIEASVDTTNHVPMKIFVDSCLATLSPDATSSPRYEIIAQNGCLLDGKQEDSSSAFRSPRPTPDRLQFTVDAFRFVGPDNSMIYITCNLRAVAENQVPDPTNKACSFSKSTNLWTALEGTSNICSCCDSGNCATVGQSRGLYSRYPGQRGFKREAASGTIEQENGSATLGPLLVVAAGQDLDVADGEQALDMADMGQALPVTQASGPMELWMLVVIVSLSLFLTVPGVVFGVSIIKKRYSSQRG